MAHGGRDMGTDAGFLINRRKQCVFGLGKLGSGYAGLDCYIAKSIMFAKIFKLRVGSVCQYLLLWQRVVRSPQCGPWG